jgi:hypothetical protein
MILVFVWWCLEHFSTQRPDKTHRNATQALSLRGLHGVGISRSDSAGCVRCLSFVLPNMGEQRHKNHTKPSNTNMRWSWDETCWKVDALCLRSQGKSRERESNCIITIITTACTCSITLYHVVKEMVRLNQLLGVPTWSHRVTIQHELLRLGDVLQTSVVNHRTKWAIDTRGNIKLLEGIDSAITTIKSLYKLS